MIYSVTIRVSWKLNIQSYYQELVTRSPQIGAINVNELEYMEPFLMSLSCPSMEQRDFDLL